MNIRELLRGVVPLRIKGELPSDISSLSCDSRRTEKGSLFFCLGGIDLEGEAFLPEAAAHGAAAVVASHPLESPLPQIIVSSPRAAYAAAWNNISRRPGERLRLLAVTGTNGKTSVTYLLRSIFRAAGISSSLIGTVGGDMTCPDPDVLYPLLSQLADSGREAVVMEASSHALALEKLHPLVFDVGVITNITRDHGDFHPSAEAYVQAKASLFDRCRVGLVGLDSATAAPLLDLLIPGRMLGYSAAGASGAEFSARGIIRSEQGTEYELVYGEGKFRVHSPMPWRFTPENSLAAASAALAAGILPRDVRTGIESLTLIPGRLERITPRTRTPMGEIYVDYAHTPDALGKAIASLRDLYSGRRITVLFGCGGERDREKRPMMGAAAEQGADSVIITSDNCRSEEPMLIISEILSGVLHPEKMTVISDRREAIIAALDRLEPDGVLLLAGKGHEEYIIDRDGRHRFSEREIVSDYAKGR